MLSNVAFLLGNYFVHVQVVPGSSIGCPLSTKQNFIKSYWRNTLTTEATGNSRRMGLTESLLFIIFGICIFGVFPLLINCEDTLRVG